MKIYIIGMLAVALLGGCALSPSQTISFDDAIQVSQATEVKYDEFNKETAYTGPTMSFGYKPGGIEETTAFMRAFKSGDNSIQYQIYVTDYYKGSWHFYDKAFDQHGTQFKVSKISRKVDSCSAYCYYYEDIAVTLTAEYLQAHIQSGVKFKAYGNGGDVVFWVPGQYIEGFLKKTKA